MDTTVSSFTLRKNAKRAAEAMIRKGTAPAVDYGIEPSANGRFEIVWKLRTPRRLFMESKSSSPRLQRTNLQLRCRRRRHHPRQRPPSARPVMPRRNPCQKLRPPHNARQRRPSPRRLKPRRSGWRRLRPPHNPRQRPQSWPPH